MVTTSDDDSSPMIPADLVLLCSSSTGVCVCVCVCVCDERGTRGRSTPAVELQ